MRKSFVFGSLNSLSYHAICTGHLQDVFESRTFFLPRWDVMPLWVSSMPSGLKVKSVIAWVKDNWSAGDLPGCFGNQYEQILFVVKGRHLLRGRRWSNVWNFPRIPHNKLLHPTQKPVELIERAILSSSDEGMIVLDPFAGSGSTAVACVNTSRHYLLSDIDKKMVDLSRKRLGLTVTHDTSAVIEPCNNCVPSLEPPDASEWGIHPEELQFLWDAINGNIKDQFDGPAAIEATGMAG